MAANKPWSRSIDTLNKTAGTNTREYIVLHHTGTDQGTGQSLDNQVSSGSREVSWHYTVYEDGSITKIGQDSDILWHAGQSYREGKSGMNQYSIGIEVVSMGEKFTKEQRQSTKHLVEYLMGLYRLGSDKVLRHKDISPNRKRDIGDAFWSTTHKTWLDWKRSLQPIPYKMTKHQSMTLDALGDLLSVGRDILDSEQTETARVCQDMMSDLKQKMREAGYIPESS